MIGYSYEDVYLIPQKSVVRSRSECSTNVKLGDHVFDLPIVPSNMSTVIDRELSLELALNNYFYIYHRFFEDLGQELLDFHAYMRSYAEYLSISSGVSKCSYSALRLLYINGIEPEFITLDIAHSHSVLTKNFVEFVKEHFPKSYLIVGNIATAEAARYLESLGVDAVKVGIAQGRACITYNETGFGVPMFTSVEECSYSTTLPVIADGGIKSRGDIAKALTRADMVMMGSWFAPYRESAAEIVNRDGKLYKLYAGSASSFVKGDGSKNIEGKEVLLEYNHESIFDEYSRIEEALQSAISYAGGTQLEDLWTVKHGTLK